MYWKTFVRYCRQTISRTYAISYAVNSILDMYRLFRQLLVLRAVFWWPYIWINVPVGSENTARHLLVRGHRAFAPNVMVWTAIGFPIQTPIIRIDGNLNINRYISDMLRPNRILEVWQILSSKNIMRDHIIRVVFWPSSMHRVFDCCLGRHCL